MGSQEMLLINWLGVIGEVQRGGAGHRAGAWRNSSVQPLCS